MMEGIANSPSTTEEHPPQSADEEPPPGVMSDEDINRLEQRGVSLWNLYNNTGDVNVLAEATDVIKRTLAHRPDGHPYRANSLNNLATALLSYHQRTNDVSSLAEAIDTFRSVLKIRLKGHPDYAGSCSNLGNALSAWHESTGDASVLEEATTLLQEALALADFGHPDPAGAYNNLAVTLLALYVRERKLPLVEKAMQLHRTALSLRPENHPRRPISCNNLAMSLLRYYEHTGDVIHLDEAIALQREAVELYPEGHPGRAEASLQLSTFLQRRFEHSGDTTILDETMELDVKALNMYPEGHPDRARACSNIAFAYIHQKHVEPYPQTLHTISKLLDAALALRPVGHPDYALICSNMVTIHYKQFLHTGSASHLDAAIEMARFPLHAEVGNYLIRANAFSNVAAVLLERCRINPNGGDAREVISMCDKAIELHVRQNRWRSLLTLADLYIIADTSVQSVSKSIDHLLEAVSLPCHDPWAMSSAAQMILIKLWSITNLPRESHLRLLTAFEALINTLPVLAGFALNKRMKLSSQETFGHLGPLAFASALAADRIELGLELLEHARGTLWSQELHVIDPKTGDLPPKMGSELETLLRSMTTTSFGDFETLDTRTLTASDIRHRHNNRIQALLTDIRSMPGFGRFMLGNTSAQLMEAARDHPVVVLVTVYEQSHAIVLKGSGDSPVVVSLNIKATELTGLRFSMSKDRSRGSATSMHGDSTDNRGLFMSLPNSGAEPTLRRIWTRIVKPVIEALGLQVSDFICLFRVVQS
jgi:tetratricopeptide (TPR) repeat protein